MGWQITTRHPAERQAGLTVHYAKCGWWNGEKSLLVAGNRTIGNPRTLLKIGEDPTVPCRAAVKYSYILSRLHLAAVAGRLSESDIGTVDHLLGVATTEAHLPER